MGLPVNSTAFSGIINQPAGYITGIDYRGVNVLGAQIFLDGVNVSLVTKVDLSDVQARIVTQLGPASSIVNQGLPGTQELRIAEKTNDNGTIGGKFITAMKFPDQCVSPCSQSRLTLAAYYSAVLCETGAATMTDYRGRSVLAAYSCIPELNVGVGACQYFLFCSV